MMSPWNRWRSAKTSWRPFAAQGAAFALAAIILGGCSPSAPKAAAPLPADVLSQGQSIYEQLCATCHFDGHGSPTAPSLADSMIVKNSPDKMITQIIHGSQGMFKANTGQEIQGIMPPLDSLPNEDIAAVVTYVRHELGKVDQLTTPGDVAKLR